MPSHGDTSTPLRATLSGIEGFQLVISFVSERSRRNLGASAIVRKSCLCFFETMADRFSHAASGKVILMFSNPILNVIASKEGFFKNMLRRS